MPTSLLRVAFKLSLPLITFSSCATLKDHHCGTSDWEAIGAMDASRLRPVEFVLNHKRVCGEGRVNTTAYEIGFMRGTAKLCEPKDAFAFGYLNKAKNPKCPADPNLETNYKDGVACRANIVRITQLRERRISEQEREKANAESRMHEGFGKTLVRSIFGGDPKSDSEMTLSEIQKIEEEQRDYQRKYEGAFIRAQYLESMTRNYDY